MTGVFLPAPRYDAASMRYCKLRVCKASLQRRATVTLQRQNCGFTLNSLLLTLLLSPGCPLIHGYRTIAFSLLWLSQLDCSWLLDWTDNLQASPPTTLIIWYFHSLSYAPTRLVSGLFVILHRLFGTLSLMKSGHQTPFHPANHLLKPIFSSSPECVYVRPCGLLHSLRGFCFCCCCW